MSNLVAKIARTVQELAPSALVELFELDVSSIPGFEAEPPFRWHAGTNDLGGNVVFDGNTYQFMPITVEGFETNSQGIQPRPKLTVAAFATDEFGNRVSLIAAIRELGELIGGRVRCIRTYAKFLDAENFAGGVNPTADPSAIEPVDEYFIDRKAGETPVAMQFELANVLEMRGVMIPRGQVVASMCPGRTVYRGELCGYTGTAYFDANDNPVSDPALDVCGRRITSCKLRHTVPDTFTSLTPVKYAEYAAEVASHSVLFNPTLAVATGYQAWPDGWLKMGPLKLSRTTRSTIATAAGFSLIDLSFSGRVTQTTSDLLAMGAGHETAWSSGLATQHVAAWLNVIRGNLLAGSTLTLRLRLFDAFNRSKTVDLLTVTAEQLANLSLWSATIGDHGSFVGTWTDDDGSHTETLTTTKFRVELAINVLSGDLYVPGDEEHPAPYADGSTMDFILRVAMPYVGPASDFAYYTTQTEVVNHTTRVLPLPFGGFAGAELLR